MNLHLETQATKPCPVENGTGSVLVIGSTVIGLATLLMASVASAVSPAIQYMLTLV